ncbi:unnamed protein product [Amoebophrya sp. A25]|nr:unnamed protein product [Amoebophrya sp. A25]|eukprot:GSA25T00018126001.1
MPATSKSRGSRAAEKVSLRRPIPAYDVEAVRATLPDDQKWMADMTPEEREEELRRMKRAQKKADNAQAEKLKKEVKERRILAENWKRAKKYERLVYGVGEGDSSNGGPVNLEGDSFSSTGPIAGGGAYPAGYDMYRLPDENATYGSTSSKKKKNAKSDAEHLKEAYDYYGHLLEPSRNQRSAFRVKKEMAAYVEIGVPESEKDRPLAPALVKSNRFLIYDLVNTSFFCKLCRNAKKKFKNFDREHLEDPAHREAVAAREKSMRVLDRILNPESENPVRFSCFEPGGPKKPYLVVRKYQEEMYKWCPVLWMSCLLCGPQHDEELTEEMICSEPFRWEDHQCTKRHKKNVNWLYEPDEEGFLADDPEARKERKKVEDQRQDLKRADVEGLLYYDARLPDMEAANDGYSSDNWDI